MPARYAISQVIAGAVYWPLARTAAVIERGGVDVSAFPLSFYRDRSFYTMRTDALDRFGTRLEQRFTRAEMQRLLEDAGLERFASANARRSGARSAIDAPDRDVRRSAVYQRCLASS